MATCFSSAKLPESDGIPFKTAIEAFDYLVKNDYSGTIKGDMSYDERVKFCRWYNANRCINNNTVLIPIRD